MYQIMIVEDDATMAEMMKRQLEAWGHQVHVAEQFQDILGEFTACAPHMVLMDIMLPFSTDTTGAVPSVPSPTFPSSSFPLLRTT